MSAHMKCSDGKRSRNAIPRRRCTSTALSVSVFGLVQLLLPSSPTTSSVSEDSVSEIIGAIERECQPMVQAVRRGGGNLLYRGATGPSSVDTRLPQLEESDLLDPQTYGEAGASFFHRLDQWLLDKKAIACSSNGHIGIANSTEAGLWGGSCSCWPRGDFHYVWLENSRLIYDEAWSAQALSARSGERAENSVAGEPFWKDEKKLDSFLAAGARIDCKIERALQQQHEILFASTGYWLVPSQFDSLLKVRLSLE